MAWASRCRCRGPSPRRPPRPPKCGRGKDGLQARLDALRRRHPDKRVEWWAEDEARLGLKPVARRVWAIKGRRPVAAGRTKYRWLYVDGFVLAVPNARQEDYRKHADDAAAVFKEHGALEVVECWGDDVPDGKQTDFKRAVQAKPEETVLFSWIEWPDKATRDRAMPLVMADPRLKPDANPMPFDGKRMIFGGFTPVVQLGS